jgi:hypothetical protein
VSHSPSPAHLLTPRQDRTGPTRSSETSSVQTQSQRLPAVPLGRRNDGPYETNYWISTSPNPFRREYLDSFPSLILTPSPEQALRHFAVSPSNAVDPTKNTSTKSGYARQCGVKHVTVESIAYAATMVALHYFTVAATNTVSRFVMR